MLLQAVNGFIWVLLLFYDMRGIHFDKSQGFFLPLIKSPIQPTNNYDTHNAIAAAGVYHVLSPELHT